MATLPPHELQYQLEHKGDNKKPDVIVSLAIMLAAAYLAVGLRFLSRRLIHAELSYDDWMMVVGVFFTSAFAAGCWVLVTMGMGKHAILMEDPIRFTQTALATAVLYTPASTTIKFSILLLYRRLFPSKKFKVVLCSIAIFLIIFALAQILSAIIQCIPVAALWNPMAHPDAHCFNYNTTLIVFAIVNALTDVIILSLPMPILWHLHASRTRKRQLMGIFGLGGLVCVVSICRAPFVGRVTLMDASWDDVNPAILSATEHSAGVISACLPTMLPIWNYLRHGRAQPPVEDTTLGPSSAKSSGPRISRMKVKFWPGRSKHDTVSSSPSGSFRRLKGEGAVGMGDLRRPIPPPKGITITTNIETSRRTSSNRADDITSGAGTRQPGW